MAEQRFWKRFLEAKWFGLVIGLAVFAIVAAINYGTLLIDTVELKVLDFNFRLKSTFTTTRVQEGVTLAQANPKQSPDILLVGVDERALDPVRGFGRWPFPRYREADLIDAFSRIRNRKSSSRWTEASA